MKTPQIPYPKLAKAIGVSELYLKREDEHPYGSHKGRSIPFMIKSYIKEGVRDFVISSSGNAALASLLFVQKHNKNNSNKRIKLRIFVGNHVDQDKLARLQQELTDPNITIEQKERPKQTAFLLGKEDGIVYLRQSTDNLALIGYAELAQDLTKIPDLVAVFIPTSSGTTAQALADSFVLSTSTPEVHIVQTRTCHPIASHWEKTEQEAGHSMAGAIVDQVAHRKDAVINLVAQTQGSGWIPLEEEIKKALDLIKKHTDVQYISANGALGVAGLIHAMKQGRTFDGSVCCIVTGQ